MKQVFKRKKLTSAKCIANILAFYELATIAETDEGLNWYNAANNYCFELSSRFNRSVSQVAGIISAYSPQAGWQENKQYALLFLLSPRARRRSLANDLKARAILKLTSEEDIWQALSTNNTAFKTRAFFLNILNPDIVTSVTIDRHAIAACMQSTDNVSAISDKFKDLTRAQYKFFEHCFVEAAQTVDILPHQMQAIVWTVYRRLRSLRKYEFTIEINGTECPF